MSEFCRLGNRLNRQSTVLCHAASAESQCSLEEKKSVLLGVRDRASHEQLADKDLELTIAS